MWNNFKYAKSISRIRNTLRICINTFSNVRGTIQRGINDFSNSRLVKFLESNDFISIVRNGAHFLESKSLITRKTEDKSRNLVDMISELKK